MKCGRKIIRLEKEGKKKTYLPILLFVETFESMEKCREIAIKQLMEQEKLTLGEAEEYLNNKQLNIIEGANEENI